MEQVHYDGTVILLLLELKEFPRLAGALRLAMWLCSPAFRSVRYLLSAVRHDMLPVSCLMPVPRGTRATMSLALLFVMYKL